MNFLSFEYFLWLIVYFFFINQFCACVFILILCADMLFWFKLLCRLDIDIYYRSEPSCSNIIKLMTLLRGQLLSVLRLNNQTHWYFMLKKWEKLLTFFQQRILFIWDISIWNFNKMLTNDIVSFERLGLEVIFRWMKTPPCFLPFLQEKQLFWLPVCLPRCKKLSQMGNSSKENDLFLWGSKSKFCWSGRPVLV